LECNGAAVSRTTYAALFSAIGTTWGSTSGSNFKVPDLRGEFVRGFDNGRGIDSGRSFAASQGSQYGQHNHGGSVSGNTGNDTHTHTTKLDNNRVFGYKQTGTNTDGETSPYGNPGNIPGWSISGNLTSSDTHSHSVSLSIANSGGTGNSSETRPRNISMIYIIKT
jgi:microcystin-dependent protein